MSIEAGQLFHHNCKGQRRLRQAFESGWRCCGQELKRYFRRCPSCKELRRG